MNLKDVICMIVISACMFGIGYNFAILRANRAIQRTLNNINLHNPNQDFTRGALWAVEFTQDCLYRGNH